MPKVYWVNYLNVHMKSTIEYQNQSLKIQERVIISIKKNLSIILLFLIIIVFSICSIYFAVRIKPAIIPDEYSHFYMSALFSSTLSIPEPTETSIRLGYSNLGRMPFMYFWFNGRVLNLVNLIHPSIDGLSKLIILRFASVLFSIITIFFTYMLTKEITENRWWSILTAFMLANTLMFVFLSGGVTYDNISNMCAVAGIYFLLRVIKDKPFLINSLTWMAFISAGTMFKINILPLAAIMGIIWILHIVEYRKYNQLISPRNWKTISLAILVLFLLGLNFFVFGVNVLKYHSLTPSCERILSSNECSSNIFNERKETLNYPEEKITLKYATKVIGLDPWTYFSDYYWGSMLKRIHGIMGHQSYYPNFLVLLFRLYYFLIFLLFIRYWRFNNPLLNTLVLICLGYLLVLFVINFNAELESGFLHAGIQGRYLFPIIGAFYSVAVFFISNIQHKWFRGLFISITVLLFTIGGPILFITYYAGINALDWFR